MLPALRAMKRDPTSYLSLLPNDMYTALLEKRFLLFLGLSSASRGSTAEAGFTRTGRGAVTARIVHTLGGDEMTDGDTIGMALRDDGTTVVVERNLTATTNTEFSVWTPSGEPVSYLTYLCLRLRAMLGRQYL